MNGSKFTLRAVLALAILLVGLPLAAQVTDHREIRYPSLPEFKIPRPETFKLKNGMTVFLMEDRELPLIEVIARIRTGSNYDPADKVGLAGLFGQVQREGGTAKMTGDAMDDFLAARAASIETGMGGDFGTASMDCLKEDFDSVLDLFHDVLRHPAFAEDKVELARVQANTSIARRNDSISAIAGREFTRLIYGKESPLSRLSEYATIGATTRDDLVAWHKKYYHPNNVLLGVVGDFDAKVMRQKIERRFGDWPAGPAFAEPEVPFSKTDKAGTYFIEKGEVTQAYVRLGHLGIKMSNPDYFAVQVMNEIFGGGFSARLFSNVRSKKGLAYSVGGGIGASFMRPGVFAVALSTKSETMAESVAALREEVQGMLDNPPTEEELKRAKDSILNSFVFNYASRGQILAQQMNYAFYGLPADFLERYRGNVEKVTREDVARVAKQYMHPDKMKLLVVGKSADFDRPVSSFGEVATIDIRIPDPPDRSPKVEWTAEKKKIGSELLSRAARGFGGGKHVQVRSLSADYQVDLKVGEQSMSASQSLTLALPDKMRVVMRLPMGEQRLTINGTSGMATMGPRPAQPLPSEMVEEALKQLARDVRLVVGNTESSELEAVAAGKETVEGASCDIVAVRFYGVESRLWIDPAGRVVKQAFQGKNPLTQTPGQVEIRYSDFRDVGGQLIPHVETMSIEGQQVIEQRLESIQINPPLETTAFDLPAAA